MKQLGFQFCCITLSSLSSLTDGLVFTTTKIQKRFQAIGRLPVGQDENKTKKRRSLTSVMNQFFSCCVVITIIIQKVILSTACVYLLLPIIQQLFNLHLKLNGNQSRQRNGDLGRKYKNGFIINAFPFSKQRRLGYCLIIFKNLWFTCIHRHRVLQKYLRWKLLVFQKVKVSFVKYPSQGLSFSKHGATGSDKTSILFVYNRQDRNCVVYWNATLQKVFT